MTRVAVLAVYAEGGNFITFLPDHDGHGAVGDAGIDCAAETFFDLFRTGGRRDVPVVRLPAEDRVAHAAAHRVGRIACAAEDIEDHFYRFREFHGLFRE